MNGMRHDQHPSLSGTTAHVSTDGPEHQWNDQPKIDQLKKLSNGTRAKDDLQTPNGVPVNDGPDDEAKPLEDAPARVDDSHHGCHHCHSRVDKVKEYVFVENKPKEVVVEGRSREDLIVRSIRPVPVTVLRKPYIAKPDSKLRSPGKSSGHAKHL